MESKLSIESFRLTSIRTQIILGFGLILGLTLLIVLINFVALRNVRTGIQETIEQASRIRELSQEFENEFLLARQQEERFLDNWRGLGFETARDRHVTANQDHITQARASLNELTELVEAGESDEFAAVAEDLNELLPALDGYESAFLTTVDRIEERSQAGGLDARLDSTLVLLKAAADQLPDSNELNRVVVEMSANEQAFFNTREQQYIDQTRLLALKAEDLLNDTTHMSWAWSDLTRPGTLAMVNDHLDTFQALELLEGDIAINAAIFEEGTAEISDITDLIRQAGAADLTQSRLDLGTSVLSSTILSAVVGLVALALGILIAWFLGRRIIRPLGELTEAAEQVGAGNLDYTVEATGQDEFSVLGRVFNQMAGQLRDMVGSLEQLVTSRTRALATSFDVSRRLSTILDREQLVSEVVEQVRSAFEYYHTHIYLLDEGGQELVMVGGTGQAGQTMLATGHSLIRGQGLVGKAAETRQPVLVTNVQEEPDWLPNPLLPQTRSEVAVPIVLGERLIGVLDVQHDVKDGLDEHDVELLESIAIQIAIALQNAELYDNAQRTADRETRVNIIQQRIQQADTIEGVLQIAARELGEALGSQRTTVQVGMSTAQAEVTTITAAVPRPSSKDGKATAGDEASGHPKIESQSDIPTTNGRPLIGSTDD